MAFRTPQAFCQPIALLAPVLWLGFASLPGLAATDSGVKATPALAKLTIGAVLPLTGAQKDFGAEAKRGYDVALGLFAAQDPELAARVQLATADDQSTGREAAQATAKLLEKDRAQVLLGSITSSSTAAVAETARAHHVPLLVPFNSQMTLAIGNGVLRGCLSEAAQGEALAQYALTTLKAKTAAAVRPLGPGGVPTASALVDGFQTAFKAGGGKILPDVGYDLATEDFAPVIQQLKSAAPQVVITPAQYLTAARLMHQAHTDKASFTFLGGDAWDTPSLVRAATPDGANHSFVAQFAADSPDHATQAFVTAFQAKYGRAPGALAALAYDNMMTLLDTFRRAKTGLKDAYLPELERSHGLAGATGIVTYDGRSEPAKTALIKGVKTGAFRLALEPAPPAAPAKPAPEAKLPLGDDVGG